MKQAKTLTERELKAVLAHCKTRKHAERDRLAMLLGHWAGLRAKEIAVLKRQQVMGDDGNIRDSFLLSAEETKGRKARRVFLNMRLQREISDYLKIVKLRQINPYLLQSQKGMAFSANTMCQLLGQIYRECGIEGASSHSGRRSCIDPEKFCSGIMNGRDTFEHGHGRRCEAMDGASEERAGSRDYPGQDDSGRGLTAL